MPNKKPTYTLHKPTGQARVRFNRKDQHPGPYGSPESRQQDDDLIAEWFARQGDVNAYSTQSGPGFAANTPFSNATRTA